MTNFKKSNVVKFAILIELVICCILVTGCDEDAQKANALDKSLINAELINTYNDIAIQNAIISQHTLYPYHFVNNSDKLNKLGMRDLVVLANHFVSNPGALNVRQNGTADQLYQARVSFVIEQLQLTGVETDRMYISDSMPSGDGMTWRKY